MDTTVDDLVQAIRELRRGNWDSTACNIAEQMGLGRSNKERAQVHDLLAEAFRQGRITCWGEGEYNLSSTEPENHPTPVPADERTHFPAICADTSYNDIVSEVSEVLGEFGLFI